jgi:HEAT repeat protein
MRKSEYVKAALAGLARNGSAADVELGRKFLFDSEIDIRIDAVRVIQKCGTAHDVTDMIRIATSSDALLQELAAEAALNLGPTPLSIAAKFLDGNDEILLSITIADLIRKGDKESTGAFLTPYLKSPNDAVRTRVVAFFVMRFDKTELEDLLSRYTQSETYYYDVVCCLDRALYSPPRLASAYLSQLKSTFYGLLEAQSI